MIWALAAGEQEHDAHDGVGNGGQNQGAAQGSADTDVLLLGILAEHDSDKSDDAFGECGAEGSQDCPDRVLGDAGLVADPLHTVNEVFAGPVHETGGEQQ